MHLLPSTLCSGSMGSEGGALFLEMDMVFRSILAVYGDLSTGGAEQETRKLWEASRCGLCRKVWM